MVLILGMYCTFYIVILYRWMHEFVNDSYIFNVKYVEIFWKKIRIEFRLFRCHRGEAVALEVQGRGCMSICREEFLGKMLCMMGNQCMLYNVSGKFHHYFFWKGEYKYLSSWTLYAHHLSFASVLLLMT